MSALCCADSLGSRPYRVFSATATHWGRPHLRLWIELFQNQWFPKLPSSMLFGCPPKHKLTSWDLLTKLTRPQMSWDIGSCSAGGVEHLPGLGWSWSPFVHQQYVMRGRARLIRQHLPPGPPSFFWSRQVSNTSFPWCMFSVRLQSTNPPVSFWFRNHRGGELCSSLSISTVPRDEHPPLLTCYHKDKKGHS